MIKLDCTRSELLSEIGAPAAPATPLVDVTDPRVVAAEVRVRLRGPSLENLFPLLEVALSERFAALPRPQVIRGLLMPLRHALGNAGKHGNGANPARTIAVELVLTRRGALVTVTDEGAGFDVARTFQRFLARKDYFKYQGDGFRHLHAAAGPVAFENGGRTLLLCFEPALCRQEEEMHSFPPLPPLANVAAKLSPRDRLPDLVHSLVGRKGFASCRVLAARALAGDECGLRFVLPSPDTEAPTEALRVLTGRLHPLPESALADFHAASVLHATAACRHLRIPRPLARLPSHPHLVLYDFQPWMNLWQYLDFWRTSDPLRHAAQRTGRALAGLHRRRALLRDAPADSIETRLARMITQAECVPGPLPWRWDFAHRLARTVETIRRQNPPRSLRPLTTIHAAFGWDCIHYGVDKHFYLQRFEHCRRGDPGLDLGGFAADLLCFTLTRHNLETYRLCRDEFLASYNARAEYPLGAEELNLYITWALARRFQAASPRSLPAAWRLLEALDAVCRCA